MKILFEYKCEKCNHVDEHLKERDDKTPVECKVCGSQSFRKISTMAFNFAEGHGKGTSGGHLMRFAR